MRHLGLGYSDAALTEEVRTCVSMYVWVLGGRGLLSIHVCLGWCRRSSFSRMQQALLTLLRALRLRKLHVHWCQEAVTDRVLEVSRLGRLKGRRDVGLVVC